MGRAGGTRVGASGSRRTTSARQASSAGLALVLGGLGVGITAFVVGRRKPEHPAGPQQPYPPQPYPPQQPPA
ncbi:MAG: hypothetical protein ACI379_16975 [Nocardioides sp.]|uniref:hypothetical protein n=1 Tax=Nocardioides sp. TaxID=35761 RepID=UPI003F0BAACB